MVDFVTEKIGVPIIRLISADLTPICKKLANNSFYSALKLEPQEEHMKPRVDSNSKNLKMPSTPNTVVPMVQTLLFDRYPFRYKPILQWVVTQGALRLQPVKYSIKWVDTLTKLLPIIIYINAAALLFLCLVKLSFEEGMVLWKDLRYWLWFCLLVTAFSSIATYYSLGFGPQSKSIVPLMNETIALEKIMKDGM